MPILCGTDLSDASASALEVARALAAQRGEDEVVLLHVVDPDKGSTDDDAVDQARAQLESLAKAPGPDLRQPPSRSPQGPARAWAKPSKGMTPTTGKRLAAMIQRLQAKA